jgi:hypothetical protein
MRWSFWRRTAAALAVVVGVGVGASTAPAAAQPVQSHVTGTVTVQGVGGDWWW